MNFDFDFFDEESINEVIRIEKDDYHLKELRRNGVEKSLIMTTKGCILDSENFSYLEGEPRTFINGLVNPVTFLEKGITFEGIRYKPEDYRNKRIWCEVRGNRGFYDLYCFANKKFIFVAIYESIDAMDEQVERMRKLKYLRSFSKRLQDDFKYKNKDGQFFFEGDVQKEYKTNKKKSRSTSTTVNTTNKSLYNFSM